MVAIGVLTKFRILASALKIFAALLPLSWQQNIQNTKLILIGLLVGIEWQTGAKKGCSTHVQGYTSLHDGSDEDFGPACQGASAVMCEQMQCNYYSIKYILAQVVAEILPGICGSPEDIDRPMNVYDNSDQDLLLVDGVLRIHGL